MDKPLRNVRLEHDGDSAELGKAIPTVRRAARVAQERAQHKQAEAQMRLQSAALEAAANAIVITDRAGTVLWVNPAFTRLTGYSAEEIVGRNPRLLKSGKQDQAFYRSLWATILAGRVWHAEMVNRRKDGSLYTEENTITPVQSEQGEITHFIAVKQDVTARKQVEENLRASEHRYQELIDNQNEGIALVDAQERFVFSNPAGDAIFGLPPGKLAGRTLKEFTTPEEYARVLEQTKRRRAGARSSYEMEFIRADGQRRWLEVTAVPRTDSAGQFVGTFGAFHDITEHKRMEQALRESEARFRKVFEESALGIAMASVGDGRFQRANAMFCQMLGYTEEELKGLTFMEVTAPEHRRADGAAAERLRQGQIRQYRTQKRYLRKNGETLWGAVTVSLIHGEDGKPLHILAMVEDITERRQAEATLQQLSGRLLRLQDEERRRIARELHDATAQEMAALSLSLSLLAASLPELERKPRDLLDRSIALADQCATGVRTLSYLLHPPLLDEMGLAGAVRDFVGGFTQRSGIGVELDLSTELKRLPREIELALFRVLQEGLRNVHRHSGSKTASIRLRQSAGEVRLEVQDAGRGISAAAGAAGRRSPGSALGVGISGMTERMRQLGGRLEIESTAGGTLVRAVVPLTRGTS